MSNRLKKNYVGRTFENDMSFVIDFTIGKIKKTKKSTHDAALRQASLREFFIQMEKEDPHPMEICDMEMPYDKLLIVFEQLVICSVPALHDSQDSANRWFTCMRAVCLAIRGCEYVMEEQGVEDIDRASDFAVEIKDENGASMTTKINWLMAEFYEKAFI